MKQKLVLSEVLSWISLLYCDLSQPVYKLSCTSDAGRDVVYTNQVSFPPGVSNISVDLVSKEDFRRVALLLRDSFVVDSFPAFSRFLERLKSLNDENKEIEKQD